MLNMLYINSIKTNNQELGFTMHTSNNLDYSFIPPLLDSAPHSRSPSRAANPPPHVRPRVRPILQINTSNIGTLPRINVPFSDRHRMSPSKLNVSISQFGRKKSIRQKSSGRVSRISRTAASSPLRLSRRISEESSQADISEKVLEINIEKPNVQLKIEKIHQLESAIEKTKGLYFRKDKAKDRLRQVLENEYRIKRPIATPSYVGPEAIRGFYSKYKTINKVNQRNQFFENLSPSSNYLNKIKQLNISPMRNGEQQIGDDHAIALADGIKSRSPTEVNISSNRISPRGAPSLISALNFSIKHLDFSNNRIGETAIKKLSSFLEEKNMILKKLNLENCKLSFKCVSSICKSLEKNKSLIELNLANNGIGEASCESIHQLIKENENLQRLFLQWNVIRATGGSHIIEALFHNTSLKYLNLSWNALNSKTGLNEFSITLGKALKNLDSLIHLDISHNNLNAIECSILSEDSFHNNTLLGLHITGNQCEVNPKGFIIPLPVPIPKECPNVAPANKFICTKIQTQYFIIDVAMNEYKKKNKDHRLTNSKYSTASNCWICEGWNEIKFEIIVPRTVKNLHRDDEKTTVMIHLDFENYEGDTLGRNPDKENSFILWRMCPPGERYFFFSVNGNIELSNLYLAYVEKFDLTNLDLFGTGPITTTLSQINFMKLDKNDKILSQSNYYSTLEQCIPRPKPIIESVVKRKKIVEIPKWAFRDSIFYGFRNDTQKLVDDCFDFDWKLINQPKITDEELIHCRNMIKSYYRTIKDIYKYLAAIGKIPNLASINLNTFTDFVKEKIKLVDGKHLKLADCDRMFIFVNGKNEEGANSMISLVRFEFLEMLFRLGLKRYYETSKGIRTPKEAIQKLIEDHLVPFHEKWCKNSQDFRRNKYWNQKCDNVLKAHLPIFQHLYYNYGGTHRKPTEPMFMSDDEFKNLILDCELIGDEFSETDIIVCFYLSKQVQVDEIHSRKHMKMTFLEFLEGIARVADIISLPPFGDFPEDWTKEKRHEQILSDKIANLIPVLYALTTLKFKERYTFPTFEAQTGLYIEEEKALISTPLNSHCGSIWMSDSRRNSRRPSAFWLEGLSRASSRKSSRSSTNSLFIQK